jgi:hypothetical protein
VSILTVLHIVFNMILINLLYLFTHQFSHILKSFQRSIFSSRLLFLNCMIQLKPEKYKQLKLILIYRCRVLTDIQHKPDQNAFLFKGIGVQNLANGTIVHVLPGERRTRGLSQPLLSKSGSWSAQSQKGTYLVYCDSLPSLFFKMSSDQFQLISDVPLNYPILAIKGP